jgi:hypothetical protein
LASGVYHASLLSSSRTVDVAMMGCAVFAMGVVGVSAVRQAMPGGRQLFEGRIAAQVGLSVLGAGLATTAAVFRNDIKLSGIKPFDSTYVTIAGVALVFLLAISGILIVTKPRRLGQIAFLGLVTGTAIFCQLGDHPGYCFCRPQDLIQAHAVWHLLMALAAALTYRIFSRIEGPPLA